MSECSRCKNSVCNPAQLEGSTTPCMTCGQAYGNHCYGIHCATQGVFGEARAVLMKLNGEESGAASPGSHVDFIAVALRCTGDPRDNA